MDYPTFNFDYLQINRYTRGLSSDNDKLTYLNYIRGLLLKRINTEKNHDKSSPDFQLLNKIQTDWESLQQSADAEFTEAFNNPKPTTDQAFLVKEILGKSDEEFIIFLSEYEEKLIIYDLTTEVGKLELKELYREHLSVLNRISDYYNRANARAIGNKTIGISMPTPETFTRTEKLIRRLSSIIEVMEKYCKRYPYLLSSFNSLKIIPPGIIDTPESELEQTPEEISENQRKLKAKRDELTESDKRLESSKVQKSETIPTEKPEKDKAGDIIDASITSEDRVARAKVKELAGQNRALKRRLSLKYNPDPNQLEQLINQARHLKTNKFSYRKLGLLIGCNHTTAKAVVKRNGLIHLTT